MKIRNISTFVSMAVIAGLMSASAFAAGFEGKWVGAGKVTAVEQNMSFPCAPMNLELTRGASYFTIVAVKFDCGAVGGIEYGPLTIAVNGTALSLGGQAMGTITSDSFEFSYLTTKISMKLTQGVLTFTHTEVAPSGTLRIDGEFKPE